MLNKPLSYSLLKFSSFLLLAWFVLDWVNYIWFKPFTPSSFFERAWIEYVVYHPEAATMTQTKSLLIPKKINAELTQFNVKFDSINQLKIARFIELLNTYRPQELIGFDKIAADHLRDFLNLTFTTRSVNNISISPIDGDHLSPQHFLVFFQDINDMSEAINYVERVKGFASRINLMNNKIQELERQETYLPLFFLHKLNAQIQKLSQQTYYQSIIFKDFESKLTALPTLTPYAKYDVIKDLEFELKHELFPAYQNLSRSLASYMAKIEQVAEPAMSEFQQNFDRDESKIYNELTQIYSTLRNQIERLAIDSFACGSEQVWSHLEPVPKDIEIEIENRLLFLKKLSEKLGLAIEMPKLKFHDGQLPFASNAFTYFGYCSKTLLVNTKIVAPEWKGHLYAEVFPGRHLQHSLTFNNKKLPTFLKFFERSSFADGWAFFALDLMGDSVALVQEKLSILKVKLEKVLLGICDIRIHQGQMSPEQSVDFLVEKLVITKEEAQLLVCDVLANPGKRSSFITPYLLFKFWHYVVTNDLGLPFSEFVSGTISQGNLQIESAFNEWMSYRFEGVKIENRVR